MGFRDHVVAVLVAGLLAAGTAATAAAQTVRIGVLNTLSGESASLGDNIAKGIALYTKLHKDDLPPGVKIDLITRDTGGPNPAQAKRLAQELIVRDKVQMLTGVVWSPNGAAIAPVVTEAKVPTVLMNAGASVIVTLSPYFVRVSFGTWHAPYMLGQWAAKHFKSVYIAVSDYTPGYDSEHAFEKGYLGAGGGKIVGSVHMPIITLDYAPYMQRVKDAKPGAVFAFVSAGRMATAIMKAYGDLGLAKSGIRFIGTGDITTDEELPNMGKVALGVITVHHYSAAATRPANKAFVAAWKKAYGPSSTPNFMAVQAWDGMDAIYSVVRAQQGRIDPQRTMELLSHYKNPNSPRGPIAIDPATRDIIQNEYLREVRMVDGHLANVELETLGKPREDPWHDFNHK